MMPNVSALTRSDCTTNAADIILDPEFRDLVPPPPEDQQKRLRDRLFEDGHREILTVWRLGPRKILLLGYDCFATIRLYGLPFIIDEREFAIREHARQFVVETRLANRNLSRLEVMYLQGVL